MRCPRCGARVYPTDDRCMDCGAPLLRTSHAKPARRLTPPTHAEHFLRWWRAQRPETRRGLTVLAALIGFALFLFLLAYALSPPLDRVVFFEPLRVGNGVDSVTAYRDSGGWIRVVYDFGNETIWSLDFDPEWAARIARRIIPKFLRLDPSAPGVVLDFRATVAAAATPMKSLINPDFGFHWSKDVRISRQAAAMIDWKHVTWSELQRLSGLSP